MSSQQVETSSPAEDARPRANWKSWAGAVLGLVVLGLAAWGLKKISGQVTLADVMAEIQATPGHLIAFAALSTFLSYVVLVGYDWFATRHLGYTHIRWPTLAAASFSSFTMSHTLGVTILTGGTVRYRIYTRAGVKPADIAMIILLCGWTFWLGIIFVAGIGLIVSPGLAEPIREWVPQGLEEWTGALMLAGVVAYTLLATVWRRSFKLLRYRFTIPDGKQTLQQIAIGTLDLALAGGALYILLLPVAGIPDLLTFLVIYAVAMVTGALAHAPGGLGVFELVIVGLMPDADKAGVLAAVALFRILYTFVPFLLGAALLAVMEARAFRAARAIADPPGGAQASPANRH
ncbi:lysylphosphatidylglycerol synthase domain-containing protein [Sandarakinorhabdus sp. AAP62]|uniref:lysylphosphatidylglycerol synthase domain-containing protein n=1 Tax=Sandarakinorhabdus sp. AAP62 TaxID=1248916 RepID=UPI00187BDFAF|nr:lysylphosphatidylglycerol synthase domain-containing protein [Sandarakinorhabdus sp. AAP62]